VHFQGEETLLVAFKMHGFKTENGFSLHFMKKLSKS